MVVNDDEEAEENWLFDSYFLVIKFMNIKSIVLQEWSSYEQFEYYMCKT
jgi:hypothetical protein